MPRAGGRGSVSPHERAREIRELVLLALGCLVVGTWLVVVLIHAVFPTHDIPAEVHGIVFLVAGALFGGAVVQNKRGTPSNP